MCFTVTTPRLWGGLELTCRAGPTWIGATGRPVTDVGGVLWRDLERHEIDWAPLTRSNVRELHPLWFGVYAGIVYHHGAGFRLPLSRHDAESSQRLPRPLQLLVRYAIARRSAFRARRLHRRLLAGDEFFRGLIDGSEPAVEGSLLD